MMTDLLVLALFLWAPIGFGFFLGWLWFGGGR